MPNLMPEVVKEVHIGEKGRRLSFLFLKPNRINPWSLTGYGAGISFWYADQVPHVMRAALVDAANGLAIYQLQGDEYTTEGMVFAQFMVTIPDWYGNGAAGRSFVRTSSPIIKLRVMRRPT